MTDRELLELAAKAAGIEVHWQDEKAADFDAEYLGMRAVNRERLNEYWNPLTDDGDAFRLMVKLELIVDTNGMHVKVGFPYEAPLAYEKIGVGDDPDAATRRAIVKAAAKI